MIFRKFQLSAIIINNRMGEGRDMHRVLVGKPEGKRPVGIPKRTWIFRKWEEVETGWSWLRIGTGGGNL